MLCVYTRHRPGCSHTDIHYRRCRCPEWIRGRLDDETHVRRSARTRSWKDAALIARKMERTTELFSKGYRRGIHQGLCGRASIQEVAGAHFDIHQGVI